MGLFTFLGGYLIFVYLLPYHTPRKSLDLRAGGGVVGKLEAPKATGYSNHHVPDYNSIFIHPEPCD